MSFDLYSLERSIDGDDTVGFSRKAILYDKSDINKLAYHHKEKLNHFSAKAILFIILRQLKHDVVSEVEIVNVGVCDLIDISVNVIYEFETTGCKKKQHRLNAIYKQTGIELIVIDVKDLPDDIFQRYLKVKRICDP